MYDYDCPTQFEPFCLLWETAETWLTLKSQWMHDAFLSLNPVTIERDHDLCTKNINKSVKNFEKLGIRACQDIAAQIKKEVSLRGQCLQCVPCAMTCATTRLLACA